MRLAVLLLSTLAGCIPSTGTIYGTPASTNPTLGAGYPYEADYALVGNASGEACGDLQQLVMTYGTKLATVGAAHPVLYEEAKFKALESLPAADNLMYIRLKVVNDGFKQCVTLTGRGYQVTRLRSRAPDGSAGAPAAPAATTPAVVPATP